MKVIIARANIDGAEAKLTCAVRLTLAEDGAVPTEVAVFPVPGTATRDGRGPFFYEPQSFIAELNAAIESGGPIALDYEHQMDDGEVRTGPVPAAGWINTVRFDEAQGVVAAVEWTETAAQMIARKEYRGFSPSFYAKQLADQVWQLTRLVGGSLVNRPAFLNLWLAKEGAADTDSAVQAEADFDNAYTEKEVKTPMDFLTILREKLALAADADEATVLSSVEALLTQTAAYKSVLEQCSADELTVQEARFVASSKFSAVQSQASELTGQLETATARLSEVSGQLETANAQIAQMVAAERTRAIDAAVEAAMTAGVITEAGRAEAVQMATASLDAFNAYVAKAQPAILAGTLLRKPAETAAEELSLTEAQLQHCKNLNIKPQTYAAELARAKAMFAK